MVQVAQTQPQISAHVSLGIQQKFDRLTRARGLRKSFVLEQALQYYFRALEELPEEAFLPARLVLSEASFQQVMDIIENPPPPTEAMLELMNGHSDSPSAEER
ncbi:MAG: DUF1778 domain-containing protein [Ardenticatenaceae bacterium]